MKFGTLFISIMVAQSVITCSRVSDESQAKSLSKRTCSLGASKHRLPDTFKGGTGPTYIFVVLTTSWHSENSIS